MKKILLFAMLSVGFAAVAQTETEVEKETKDKGKSEWYIGIGGATQGKYNLNDKLSNANLPTLNNTSFEFALGWNVFEDKYSGDFEIGGIASQNDLGNDKNRHMGVNIRLRPHYNFVVKEKVAFTGGLNFTYTTNQVDAYSSDNIVDLNNLAGVTNVLTLRNAMFYTGPSVALYLFRDKSFKTRINLGYELALTRGRWKSDFSGITNTVGESGNNRFIFGITLL